MSLTYSLDGIRQRSYKVWLIYPTSGSSGEGLDDVSLSQWIEYYIVNAMADYKYGGMKTNLDNMLSASLAITESSEKLGECRKDSIVLTGEDGESVEGNEVGTLVLGKNCSFSAELLNATPRNINTLVNDIEHKIPFYVVLEEVEGQTKAWPTGLDAPDDFVTSEDTHEIIFVGINNALIGNLVENHVGGGISTVTLSASDTVARIGDFRQILDVPYDLEDY